MNGHVVKYMGTELHKAPIPSLIKTEVKKMTGVISDVTPVGGGCIANATRLSAQHGTFFLKWGHGEVAGSFGAEAEGLQFLRLAGSSLKIPEVVACEAGEHGYLLLEWLDQGHATPQSWERFGRGLAELHRHIGSSYGLERDNFIGRSNQVNDWKESWPAFFRSCRLEPQVRMARESGHWQDRWNDWLDGLFKRLDSLIPASPPASLVHGDLWGGNFMSLVDGQVALIDPAVYYGDREVDLAMTELFGGFKNVFYESYWEEWPVDTGYAERKEIYNLYHLLNHLNLFGASYERGVEKVLKRFGN